MVKIALVKMVLVINGPSLLKVVNAGIRTLHEESLVSLKNLVSYWRCTQIESKFKTAFSWLFTKICGNCRRLKHYKCEYDIKYSYLEFSNVPSVETDTIPGERSRIRGGQE